MSSTATTSTSPLWSELDTTSDEQIVNFCVQAWKNRPEAQTRAELQGELAALWITGDQHLFHVPRGSGFVLEPLPNPNRRLRPVFNAYGPLFAQWHARVGMDPLEPEAVPQTGSQPDLDATRLQTALSRYYRDLLDMEAVKDQMVRLIGQDGMAFTKVCWDPLAGNEFEITPADLRKYGIAGDGGSETDALRLHLGEVRVDNVPLRNLTWGPVGVPFEQAEWVLEAHERSRSDVMSRWNLKAEEISDAYEDVPERWYRGEWTNQGTTRYKGSGSDIVVTFELWAPRSPRLRGGLHAVIVGNQVVNRRRNAKLTNPYRHGRVPYAACYALRRSDAPYGHTPAWDGFWIQAMINQLVGQIMEIIERCANPRTWARSTEPIEDSDLAGKPGGIIRYKGERPITEPGTGPDTALYAILDRWMVLLQEAFGIHDASRGKAPAGGRSGRYLLALQDADDTRLGPTRRSVQRWACDVFHLLLECAAQFVSEERMIAIRGADNAWERRAFRGQDLIAGRESSGPQRFNIRMRTSGAARSRAAQVELVTLLIQSGFYKPENPEHVRAVLTMLELGDTTGRLDLTQQDRDAQRRVHDILATGRYVPPQWFQNHEVRRNELLKFMNDPSGGFERLSPEIQGLFKRYFRESIQIEAKEKLEQQLTAQNAMQQVQARMEQTSAQSEMKQRLAALATGPPEGGLGPALGRNGEILRRFAALADRGRMAA